MTRSPRRPRIAFLDYADVFEDFYTHYGVSQQAFATTWADTAAHSIISVMQRDIGDVTWYMLSVAPEVAPDSGPTRHRVTGARVRILPSSAAHRALWRAYYASGLAWRWGHGYRAFETVASPLAMASLPLLRALKRDRPDVLFVQDYATGRYEAALVLARLLGVPLVTFHSGSWPEMYLLPDLKRRTIRRADWIFPSGTNETARLASRFGVDPARMSVIRPPIDTAQYRILERAPAAQAAGLDPARRYLLFVGRFEDEIKRISAIIDAFASAAVGHADVDLLLVGDGPDRARIADHAARTCGDRVRLLGWISDPAHKAPIFSLAEALVLASKSEAAPAVIGESLACGTPVVATRVGAIGDTVRAGVTGWIVPPGDDRALELALRDVLDRPEMVAALRPRARAFAVANWSLDAFSRVVRSAFEDVGVLEGPGR